MPNAFASRKPATLDLGGLSSLTSLGEVLDMPPQPGPLHVFDNPALPECWVVALETQTGTTCGFDSWGVWMPCTGNDGIGRLAAGRLQAAVSSRRCEARQPRTRRPASR